jgi:hypothetical protein
MNDCSLPEQRGVHYVVSKTYQRGKLFDISYISTRIECLLSSASFINMKRRFVKLLENYQGGGGMPDACLFGADIFDMRLKKNQVKEFNDLIKQIVFFYTVVGTGSNLGDTDKKNLVKPIKKILRSHDEEAHASYGNEHTVYMWKTFPNGTSISISLSPSEMEKCSHGTDVFNVKYVPQVEYFDKEDCMDIDGSEDAEGGDDANGGMETESEDEDDEDDMAVEDADNDEDAEDAEDDDDDDDDEDDEDDDDDEDDEDDDDDDEDDEDDDDDEEDNSGEDADDEGASDDEASDGEAPDDADVADGADASDDDAIEILSGSEDANVRIVVDISSDGE